MIRILRVKAGCQLYHLLRVKCEKEEENLIEKPVTPNYMFHCTSQRVDYEMSGNDGMTLLHKQHC